MSVQGQASQPSREQRQTTSEQRIPGLNISKKIVFPIWGERCKPELEQKKYIGKSYTWNRNLKPEILKCASRPKKETAIAARCVQQWKNIPKGNLELGAPWRRRPERTAPTR